MKFSSLAHRQAQRGIVAVMAVIFLITAVVFVLVQSLNITGTTSVDNKQELDSTRALFLAESGLERANAIIATATKGVFSANNCCVKSASGLSCVLPNTSQILDSGSYTYNSATVTPSTGCDGIGTACTACTVTVSGVSGLATRQISRTFLIVPPDSSATPPTGVPVNCNSTNSAVTTDCSNSVANTATTPTWALVLPSSNGIGVFNLAADFFDGDTFSNGNGGMTTQWSQSIGGVLGIGSTFAQPTSYQAIFQRLSNSRNVAFSGAFFKDLNGSASVFGMYPPPGTSLGSSTGAVTGSIDDGASTYTASSLHWCDDAAANILVFGYSAHSSAAKANQLTNVGFDTRGGSSGIPLDQVVAAKSPSASDSLAENSVYADIWYKKNTPYNSGGKWISGQIITSQSVSIAVKLDNKSYQAAIQEAPSGPISSGAPVDPSSCSSAGILPGTTITGFYDGAKCNDFTNVTFEKGDIICLSTMPTNSANCQAKKNPVNVITASILKVASVNGNSTLNLLNSDVGGGLGQTLAGQSASQGITLVSKANPFVQPSFIGIYNLSSGTLPTSPAGTNLPMVVGGASIKGSTVTFNNISPAVNQLPNEGTIVSVRTVFGMTSTQTGRLYPNTVVQGIGTNYFTLSSSAMVDNTGTATGIPNTAVICGGTCAFFDHDTGTDGQTLSKTTFRIASGSSPPAGTDSWVSGFICLKNADVPYALLGPLLSSGSWHEVVK